MYPEDFAHARGFLGKSQGSLHVHLKMAGGFRESKVSYILLWLGDKAQLKVPPCSSYLLAPKDKVLEHLTSMWDRGEQKGWCLNVFRNQ